MRRAIKGATTAAGEAGVFTLGACAATGAPEGALDVLEGAFDPPEGAPAAIGAALGALVGGKAGGATGAGGLSMQDHVLKRETPPGPPEHVKGTNGAQRVRKGVQVECGQRTRDSAYFVRSSAIESGIIISDLVVCRIQAFPAATAPDGVKTETMTQIWEIRTYRVEESPLKVVEKQPPDS